MLKNWRDPCRRKTDPFCNDFDEQVKSMAWPSQKLVVK
jgi:hypothetical protein